MTAKPGARERLARAQAERIEFENALRGGVLMWVADVMQTFSEYAANGCRHLDSIGGRLAAEVPGVEPWLARKTILAATHGIRRALADHTERESARAPAADAAERVGN